MGGAEGKANRLSRRRNGRFCAHRRGLGRTGTGLNGRKAGVMSQAALRLFGGPGTTAVSAPTAKRILVVDDDEALRQSLGEQLRLHEEFVTVEVGTGADALATTKREYFDAVLLDVRTLGEADLPAVVAAVREALV